MIISRLLRYGRFFWFAWSSTVLVLVAVWYYLGFQAALLATLLVVLEVTFSFENSVINARVLKYMSRFWQQIFLTIGILIAVFGMRIVFPILLVSITAQLPMGEVLTLALNSPQQYTGYLESAMPTIASFGGMFLLMVFLNYFVLENTDKLWLTKIETRINRLPKRWYVAPGIAFAVLIIVALAAGAELFQTVLTAGSIGVATYMLIHGLVSYMQSKHLNPTAAAKKAGKVTELTGVGGLLAFLYLEVLDASFSLDGVIGAFAITTSVILIAAGLGVGAVWVRSITIYLVRHQTLGRYAYLEHGAHYAIGLLALVLLADLFVHVPEMVTGLLGVSIIAVAIVASVRLNANSKKSGGSVNTGV